MSTATAFAPTTEALPTEATPFQARVLAYRRTCSIANLGGRGSGKSVSLIMDILDHCREYGPVASVLVLRESWAGLTELATKLNALATIAFGPRTSLNKGSGVLTLPNGANVYFRNIADDTSFASAQGRTYSLICPDEFGNYPGPAIEFTIRLFSNLRPPKHVLPRVHLTANPFGRAHTYCLRNFVNKALPWKPWQDDFGNWWVNCHSTLDDNPTLDQDRYRQTLRRATAGNPALTAAWVDGSWTAKGAGMMFDLFDPQVHIKDPPSLHRMRFKVGADWGTSSPAVAILLGELLDPTGHHIPGDMFAIDMVDTCVKGSYSEGDGSPASVFAAMIKTLLDQYGISRNIDVVVDDMRSGIGGAETVVGIFHEQGLRGAAKVREKNRVGGWARIRNYLDGAINGDSKGLWISPKCGALIDTMQTALRDDLRPEDLSRHLKEDHHLDALNYGVHALASGARTGNGTVIGYY